MRLEKNWAMGTVRFSVGKDTTEEEVVEAADKVINIVKILQSGITPPEDYDGPIADNTGNGGEEIETDAIKVNEDNQ